MPTRADPVAAQGNVDVVPEPAGQGDVPAPPELRDAAGQVGVVEVLQEREPQHAAHADGHVRIAAEVEVDLQRVGRRAQPGRQDRAGGGCLDGLVQQAQVVGQQHLLGKAQDHPLQPLAALGQRRGALFQLCLDVGVLHDGPRHQLGEHGDVGGEVDEAALGLRLAPVDVDHIAQRLEGVEGYADGQRQLGRPYVQPQRAVQRVHQESGILEKAQHAQVDRQRRDERGPAGRGPGPHAQLQAGHVVVGDAEQHQPHVHRLAPGVEIHAGRQQHRVLEPLRDHQVQQHHRGKEQEEEVQAAEYHPPSPPIARRRGTRPPMRRHFRPRRRRYSCPG